MRGNAEMKPLKFFILSILIGLMSCQVQAQRPDNTRPMYGEVEKSDEYKKLDEDFKNNCLEQFKTIDSAVFFHIDRAWRYFYNNDLKTAMKRFNQAWLLDPEYPDSYFGFAALLEMQDNKEEAVRFYRIGLEKDKTKERAKICYQHIADCKYQLQNTKGAIEAYRKLIELDSANVSALKNWGYLQMQNGDNISALIAYNKAIELDPADAMTFNNRGYLYQTQKNYENAIADYTKAIELDPKYISAYANRGITEMETGNYQAAKQDFEFCVQIEPGAGSLRRYLAMARLNLNDKSGACKDFKLAKELGDTQAEELIQQNCN